MLELGTKAPKFSLEDVISGKTYDLKKFRGNKALLVIFICNHCPYVKLIKESLVEYATDYMPKGVGIVAISSNDVVNYPQDAPDKMYDIAGLNAKQIVSKIENVFFNKDDIKIIK